MQRSGQSLSYNVVVSGRQGSVDGSGCDSEMGPGLERGAEMQLQTKQLITNPSNVHQLWPRDHHLHIA